jgi:aromatic ring hydroxylase
MEVLIPFEEIFFLGKWNLQQSFFFSQIILHRMARIRQNFLTDSNHEFGLENAFSLLNNK